MITLVLEAETIQDLVRQINAALGAVQEAPADEPAAEPKKTRGKAKAAKAPDPETEPEQDDPAEPEIETLTLALVKDHVHAYAEAAVLADPKDPEAARNAFKSILDHFKIERFSKLKEENFAEAVEIAVARKAELDEK